MGLQQKEDSQPLLQQQPVQQVQQPVQQQQPVQADGFVGYPPQYAYAIPYSQNNFTGNYQVPPPPGYYNNSNVFQPQPVVIKSSSSHCHKDDSSDLTGALIVFVCGFFLSCIWLAGFLYLKSRNPTARFFSIASITLFFIGIIVAIIVVSVVLTAPTYYANYSYSSYSSYDSSSYY